MNAKGLPGLEGKAHIDISETRPTHVSHVRLFLQLEQMFSNQKATFLLILTKGDG